MGLRGQHLKASRGSACAGKAKTTGLTLATSPWSGSAPWKVDTNAESQAPWAQGIELRFTGSQGSEAKLCQGWEISPRAGGGGGGGAAE